MEAILTQNTPAAPQASGNAGGATACPFSQEWITITKQEHIELKSQASYWKAQHDQVKIKLEKANQKISEYLGKIKDLKNRVFGKKTEKGKSTSENKDNPGTDPKRPRGQQQFSQGHGRTERPDLPVVPEEKDLPDAEKVCPNCGLPHRRNPALDEHSDVIEVKVKAHIRRIHRPAYTPGCDCPNTPAIITAPPPPRLIPHSPYGVSFWVEVILRKYRYGQPSNRYLTDLSDQGLPVSPGTLAGGLQKLAPLFDPIQEALYCKQMSEELFHNDETRWEVFVQIEGKQGTRWYLWVTRSSSVIYYCIDPSRSAAVPGAHFAGLQKDRVIIVCDRYSAYKKLARLSDLILLAFCWAHVRRDFLDAARSFGTLEPWALEWKEHIGLLYHLNSLRLEQWDAELPIEQQSTDFHQHHASLEALLHSIQEEAQQVVSRIEADNIQAGRKNDSLVDVKSSAEKQQVKVYRSLLNHWDGLTLFMQNPHVPLDNNLAEGSIRNPVTGRGAYYGSGSILSAELAAMLFSILQTINLWNINPRHWLFLYLNTCAENGGNPPEEIAPFLPWEMDEDRRRELSRPIVPKASSP